MKCKYIISILLFFIAVINVFGQSADNLKTPKYKRVNEAYGFLTGQDYSLDLIKKKYPHFEMTILNAKLSFNSTFGKSKEEMKKYLTKYIGQNEFMEFELKLKNKIKIMLDNQTLTEDIATSFISEVESRAKGNIASPVLETILSFQFYDRPQDELTSGFTTTFKTKGHYKSKNTDWQIKVPKSWKAEEADRPNIIKKFRSDYGDGNQSIMLIVKEMPQKISKIEINNFFTEKSIIDIIPEAAKFIAFKKMSFDGNNGGMVEIEQTTTTLDIERKVRLIQFMFIRENKFYTLQCAVGDYNLESNLELEMKNYFPLYWLVASTIVVFDQYK